MVLTSYECHLLQIKHACQLDLGTECVYYMGESIVTICSVFYFGFSSHVLHSLLFTL